MSESVRSPLTRDRIVAAAVELADAGGLAAMSMRKVAAQLGFEVMSLYNHVANKDDLTALMADHVAGEIELPDDVPDWRGAIRAQAISTKQMFTRHPWVVDLWVTAMPGPNRFDQMEWTLRRLDASGLSERSAHDAFHAVNNHVVGYMLSNLAMAYDDLDLDALVPELMSMLDPDRHRHVIGHIEQHLDGDTGPSFELVLDLILDGIAG